MAFQDEPFTESGSHTFDGNNFEEDHFIVPETVIQDDYLWCARYTRDMDPSFNYWRMDRCTRYLLHG